MKISDEAKRLMAAIAEKAFSGEYGSPQEMTADLFELRQELIPSYSTLVPDEDGFYWYRSEEGAPNEMMQVFYDRDRCRQMTRTVGGPVVDRGNLHGQWSKVLIPR